MLAEPWRPRPSLPLSSYFSSAGWRERGRRFLSSVKNVYTLAKIRQAIPTWTLSSFKEEAKELFETVSKAIAQNDKHVLRQLATESVQAAVRKEQAAREAGGWQRIVWSLIDVQRISLIHGRLLAPNPSDTANSFAQLTVELLTRQQFAAYNTHGALVAGDPAVVLVVTERWVLERLLGGGMPATLKRWRVAARLSTAPSEPDVED